MLCGNIFWRLCFGRWFLEVGVSNCTKCFTSLVLGWFVCFHKLKAARHSGFREAHNHISSTLQDSPGKVLQLCLFASLKGLRLDACCSIASRRPVGLGSDGMHQQPWILAPHSAVPERKPFFWGWRFSNPTLNPKPQTPNTSMPLASPGSQCLVMWRQRSHR